jgi:signal transduction histidine kinase
VTNLLSNALKYGAGKPIQVVITADERTARLVVRDRGIGMSATDQARIFQRFERAVTARDYGGLGLGLWISKQIVIQLGGEISVDSMQGLGTTFTVSLPLSGPAQ